LVPAGFTGAVDSRRQHPSRWATVPLRGAARTGSARILRARSNPARRRVRSRRLPGAAGRSLREPHRFRVARSAPLDPNTRSQLSYPPFRIPPCGTPRSGSRSLQPGAGGNARPPRRSVQVHLQPVSSAGRRCPWRQGGRTSGQGPVVGFDLINAFNAWKRSEAAGRVCVAAPDGTITKQVTGLGWRHEVSAQVFEEAAVDLGRALSAYSSNSSETHGDRVGFPRWKRKGRCRDSFRLRNKQSKGGGCSVRIGEGHPRSVTPPTIGMVRVHDDTRRLRRLLRPVAQLDPPPGSRGWRLAPRSCSLWSAGMAPAGMSA
jgi:hypothetical protein